MARNRLWSEEEVNYLEEYWGIRPIEKMAKKLRRTENAIMTKAKKIGLGGYTDAGDLITVWQLTQALGFEGSSTWWTKDVLLKNGLPVIETRVAKKIILKVKIEDFWKWAEQNKRVLNFTNFQKGSLGKEPEWVDEKRKVDLAHPTKRNRCKKWSQAEDNLLLSMVKTYRYTYKDIAKELDRTEHSIRRRLYTLNTPYRPIPAKKSKWTEEEREKMIELYKKGYDSYTISKAINKYQTSMYNRIKECGL